MLLEVAMLPWLIIEIKILEAEKWHHPIILAARMIPIIPAKKISLQSWKVGSWKKESIQGHLPHNQMKHLSYSLSLIKHS